VVRQRFRPRNLENVAGFASQVPGRNVFVMNAEVEGNNRSQVVCHEYTHLYLGNNFPDLPAWLNEGLAEYYGTFRPRGLKAEVGHRRDPAVEWLGRNELVDLDLMFAMNTRAEAYTGDYDTRDFDTGKYDLRRATYAQDWAFVHYLEADPHRAEKLRAFLEALRQGVAARLAFEQQFPPSEWPRLLAAVRHHVREEFIEPRSMALDHRLVSAPTTSRTVHPPEAATRLGELLCDLGAERCEDGAAYFRAALERDSTFARAWSGAGFAADVGGDSSGAERCYARAEALAPGDLRVALVEALGTTGR